MTYTLVLVEQYDDISKNKLKFNLKIYGGFFPFEQQRGTKRVKHAFEGTTIESLVNQCKLSGIKLNQGSPLDYITTTDSPVISGSMMWKSVSPDYLLRFYKKMINSKS